MHSPQPKAMPLIPVLFAAVALAAPLLIASPARAQASPACYSKCAPIFDKHIAALTKCVSKQLKSGGTSGSDCTTKAQASMYKKWRQVIRPQCGDAACGTAYPLAPAMCGNIAPVQSSIPTILYAANAIPPDTSTLTAMEALLPSGCGF